MIGVAGYLVELDSDLDGDNDAADRPAFDALFPTADIAAPFGVLDLADLVTFPTGITASDPVSDFAPPYGVWDLIDRSAFISAFSMPCPETRSLYSPLKPGLIGGFRVMRGPFFFGLCSQKVPNCWHFSDML